MSLLLPPNLTVPQDAIWRDQQLFQGRPIYNTGQVLSIEGDLQFNLFERALRETVAESPCLRLAPRSAPLHFELPLVDARGEKNPLNEAEQYMRNEMRQAIPLEDPVLFRFVLIRITDTHTLWFQKYHHIIIDATGRRLISARTAVRYRTLRFGESLPALNSFTPEEILEAERCYKASGAHESDRVHWLKRFAHWPGPLLEMNRQNTERAKSGCHARTSFSLKRDDFIRLETAADSWGTSAFRAIIALTYAAFARVYDRSEIVLGVQLAYRSDEKAKQVIGLMARPLPMLLKIDHSTSIADAVRQIDGVRAQDYRHRYFPMQELVAELGIMRQGHHGLYDAIINYIPAAYDFSFEEFPVEISNLSYGFPTPWMVTITDTGAMRDVGVTIDTDPGLITPDMAARLASCVKTLLLRSIDDPTCAIASLPIMPESTLAQVRSFAAGPIMPVPDEATVATLCAAQAKRTPDAVALIADQQQLTFAALHERAEHLARRLAARGVRPGVVVAIALPREPALVVAVLAVHKAGGAYLALDPSYPADRIKFIVADAAAPVILTTAALAPRFADSGAHLLIDTEMISLETNLAEPVPAGPSDLAYVLYTSGSTGRPKPVGIEHRNIVNLISWGRSIVSDTELSGFLFSTSLNFDLSAFEMFVPLAFGGRIILVENLLALQSSPLREKVCLINTGPSLIDAALRSDALPQNVTSVILAGERLSRRLASSFFKAAPTVRLLNCYGPTETTVYSSWAAVDPAAGVEPTIGRPIWNTALYVHDSGGALVPPGAEGELYIGGAGVARGYLCRPELTTERFIPNPYGPGKLYRTGDRVRWRQDGELDFLGRTDEQFKINGIRVEPGEIEANLLAIPGIAAAAVRLNEDTSNSHYLIAYLVKSCDGGSTTEEVRSSLERQLPQNMVPSTFVWLDAMPLTPNGKLDRKALPTPPRNKVQVSLSHLPTTRLERAIAEIWRDVLSVSAVDIQSDFFDLGGDSLALLNLFATIESRFGQHLTLDALSGGLTIAGLARLLAENEQRLPNEDPVVPLQPSGHLPPLFCVPGIGGDLFHLQRLAMHMGTKRPFVGLRIISEVRATNSVSQMAGYYVDAILRYQPTGPFYLCGYSFGAALAYEMAAQLLRQGYKVGRLAIIDQRRPGRRLTARMVLAAPYRILAHILRQLHSELSLIPAADRFRHVQRKLLLWSTAALGQPGDGFMSDFSAPEKIMLQALRSYKPTVVSVPITLFRANVQRLSVALDSTLGWRDLVKGQVRVCVLPGDHISIMREPLVQQLAKMISDDLDVAQGVSDHFKGLTGTDRRDRQIRSSAPIC
jgi:enterobactin synthetase component F